MSEPTAAEPRPEQAPGAQAMHPEPTTQQAQDTAPKRRPITITCDCD